MACNIFLSLSLSCALVRLRLHRHAEERWSTVQSVQASKRRRSRGTRWAGRLRGSARLSLSLLLSSRSGIPMSKTTETSLVSPNQVTLFSLFPSTSSSEEPHVRHSPSLDSEKGCVTLAVASRWSTSAWLAHFARDGSSGKTSPASCHQDRDGTLVPSSGRWSKAGMASLGGCWTLNMCEWTDTLTPSHSDGSVCSLSDVLEETHLVQPQYFLSQRACEGILRRAEARGKTLPPMLEQALKSVSTAS
jgi:hypothetical protein